MACSKMTVDVLLLLSHKSGTASAIAGICIRKLLMAKKEGLSHTYFEQEHN